MRPILSALLGAMLAVNGSYMLAAPGSWYDAVPGVAESGPLNAHFVRDIGTIYLLTGLAFLWLARSPRARGAALVGALFLALHGLIHLGEGISSDHWHNLASMLACICAPAVLALWLAFARPGTPSRKENDHASLADQALHRCL